MEIILVHTADTPIVSVRENIAIRYFGTLMDKAFSKLLQSGAKCVGNSLAVYHSPIFDFQYMDLEIGFPVRPQDKYTRILKGCLCAFGLHWGDYSLLQDTYTQIAEWIKHQGYAFAGPPFEIYLNDPRQLKAQELLTEVYFPVKK